MNIQGKVAVVTGVSKGIGLATVKALAENGATVFGIGRTSPDFKHANFSFMPCNVSNPEAVAKAFEAIYHKTHNTIHILINNAGVGFSGKMHETRIEDWKEMFDTNVHGVFYCSRLAIPKMIAQQEGHIINIASIAGKSGLENFSGYCGSKFAVRGISESLFKEYRNDGIKVSCIYPGSVMTNFFDNIDGITANENMMMPEDIACTIIDLLETSANYLPAEIEVRPLMPAGRK